MNIYLILALALIPCLSCAEVYKCDRGGDTVIHQFTPCQNSEQMINSETKRQNQTADKLEINKNKRLERNQKQDGFSVEYRARIEAIRRQARDSNPVRADRICAEAKAKEQATLAANPIAEQMMSRELFALRSQQDLYCESYEGRNTLGLTK